MPSNDSFFLTRSHVLTGLKRAVFLVSFLRLLLNRGWAGVIGRLRWVGCLRWLRHSHAWCLSWDCYDRGPWTSLLSPSLGFPTAWPSQGRLSSASRVIDLPEKNVRRPCWDYMLLMSGLEVLWYPYCHVSQKQVPGPAQIPREGTTAGHECWGWFTRSHLSPPSSCSSSSLQRLPLLEDRTPRTDTRWVHTAGGSKGFRKGMANGRKRKATQSPLSFLRPQRVGRRVGMGLWGRAEKFCHFLCHQ